MCVCVCVHTCAWAYIYTHTRAHMYGCTHIRVYTCMCICPTHSVTNVVFNFILTTDYEEINDILYRQLLC